MEALDFKVWKFEHAKCWLSWPPEYASWLLIWNSKFDFQSLKFKPAKAWEFEIQADHLAVPAQIGTDWPSQTDQSSN